MVTTVPTWSDAAAAALSYGRWVAIAACFFALVYRARHRIPWPVFGFEVALGILAYFAYFFVRGLTEGDFELAAANGWDIVHLEQRLGIYWEHGFQDALLVGQWATTLFNWIYIWGHWPVIVITGAWLLIQRPAAYRRYRNAFLISGGIGLVIFAIYPVAPPRLIELGIVDTVTEHSNAYRVLQPGALTNQYAALPSLHFGWNLLIGIAWYRELPWRVARVFGVLLPLAMGTAIVATGNHYVVDVVAGGALALGAYTLASRGAAVPALLSGRASNNPKRRPSR